ncbi:MAG: SdpI family protein [Chitinophagaceae bacterium]|nr:SdpI family protein [Chitinophagaceae bacterium]
MDKLFDLRFVIGAFFTLVGILLLIYGLTSSEENAQTVNRWCGIIFIVFGVMMIVLSFQKDAADEILEDDIKDPEDLKKILS